MKNAIHSQFSLDCASGALYENSQVAGQCLSALGTITRIIDQANEAPSLARQLAEAQEQLNGANSIAMGVSTRAQLHEVQLRARAESSELRELAMRAALEKLVAWFKSTTRPAVGYLSADELLLAGCPNELAGDIAQARAALGGGK